MTSDKRCAVNEDDDLVCAMGDLTAPPGPSAPPPPYPSTRSPAWPEPPSTSRSPARRTAGLSPSPAAYFWVSPHIRVSPARSRPLAKGPETVPAAPRHKGGRRREAVSLIAWWAVLTLALWLLGQSTGRPAGLAPSTASAAILAAIGEARDWVRRRWTARRHHPDTPPLTVYGSPCHNVPVGAVNSGQQRLRQVGHTRPSMTVLAGQTRCTCPSAG